MMRTQFYQSSLRPLPHYLPSVHLSHKNLMLNQAQAPQPMNRHHPPQQETLEVEALAQLSFPTPPKGLKDFQTARPNANVCVTLPLAVNTLLLPLIHKNGKKIIRVDDPTEITNVTTNPPPQTDYTPNNLLEILTSEDRPPSVLHIPEDETSATAWPPSLWRLCHWPG